MKKILAILICSLITGTSFTQSSSSKNQLKVLIFLSAKCPCAYNHRDSFKSLISKYRKQIGFSVVFVGKNDDKEEIDDMIKNLDWGIKYLTDKNGEYLKKYKPKVFTDVVLIDSLGEVIYRGGIDDGPLNSGQIKNFYLKNAIEDYMNEKPVKTKEGKGFGCLIL